MKSLVFPVLIVAVVLIAWAVFAGGGTGWLRGSQGAQSMGMHRGMHGMMMTPGAAAPADAPAAFSQYPCGSCHALHDGGVGPAFSWVAWRYRGQPGAQETLAAFIAYGGQGPWGGIMPNLSVPSVQAHELAQWILALPPEAPPKPERFK
jgi:cytochrome c